MAVDIKCEGKSDKELVELTLENQDYFLCIVKKYKEKLFRYIMRLTDIGQEDAEDVLQEVFIKAYVNLNNFNSDLKFSSWIYRIAHNQVISHYRKLKARPQGNSVPLEDLEYNKVLNIAADFDIKKNIDLELLRKSIFKILNGLDEKYREILILKFFEDMAYEEISDIIKRPIGTVASLMNKAKQEFNKELIKQNIKL